MASALRSRGFVTHAIITVAAVALLATICGILVHVGRLVRRARTAGARSGQDGVAMIEFALVLPVALILVLFMAQSALLMVGHLCVHYSAYCAARAAIVYVPLGRRSSSWESRQCKAARVPPASRRETSCGCAARISDGRKWPTRPARNSPAPGC